MLAVGGTLACGPTGAGDVPCGQFDLTQNGPIEMCGSASDCPGSDMCIDGFCVGTVCDAGMCEPTTGTDYACSTSTGTSKDAAADSRADASADSGSHDAHADARRGSDASKDVAAER
jgi:hypothetical protein